MQSDSEWYTSGLPDHKLYFRIIEIDKENRKVTGTFDFGQLTGLSKSSHFVTSGSLSNISYDYEPRSESQVSINVTQKPDYITPRFEFEELDGTLNFSKNSITLSYQCDFSSNQRFYFTIDAQLEHADEVSGTYGLRDTTSDNYGTGYFSQNYGSLNEKVWTFTTQNASRGFLYISSYDRIHERVDGSFFIESFIHNSTDTMVITGDFEKVKLFYTF